MTLDPLAQAEGFLTRAREERDTLQRQVEATRVELHQLRRRLERSERRESDLHVSNAALELRAEAAEQRADTAERAMRDHAVRSA